MAPIKRPLSIKNTPLSQKTPFFCRFGIRPKDRLLPLSAPGFSKDWSATRHPSGSRQHRETPDSVQPLVQETDPRKTSVPCHVQWVVTKQRAPSGGLLAGQALRAHNKGRSVKSRRPEFAFRAVQRCANQAKRLLATITDGITAAVPG
jgi:hypothetical protein